jgi:hypothetical protein
VAGQIFIAHYLLQVLPSNGIHMTVITTTIREQYSQFLLFHTNVGATLDSDKIPVNCLLLKER